MAVGQCPVPLQFTSRRWPVTVRLAVGVSRYPFVGWLRAWPIVIELVYSLYSCWLLSPAVATINQLEINSQVGWWIFTSQILSIAIGNLSNWLVGWLIFTHSNDIGWLVHLLHFALPLFLSSPPATRFSGVRPAVSTPICRLSWWFQLPSNPTLKI